VAARDKNKATAFGKKYGIGKIYSGPTGYQRGYLSWVHFTTVITAIAYVELLDDPEVDAVYNPVGSAHILLTGLGADCTRSFRMDCTTNGR
jgi:hypothetical protein